jgi:uncharacterized membrane protein
MDDTDLGIDRMVVAMWSPEDTWPATLEESANEDEDDAGGGGGASDPPTTRNRPGSTEAATDGDLLATAVWPDDEPEPVEAVAAIDGHPLHPFFAPLPTGAFVGAFLADLAYVRTHDRFWARSARVLTGAGLATGLLAGAFGAADFTARRPIRRHASAWVHAGGNLAVLGLAATSSILRAQDERRVIRHGGLAISAATAAILGLTGWLGGELAFRDRIGVTKP